MQLRGWSLSHSILPSIDNVSFYHSFILQLCHNWQYCWSVLFNIYVCTLAKSKTDGDCGEKSFSENYRLWGTTWSCSTCSSFNTATQLNYFTAARTWISVCQAQGPVRQKRTDPHTTSPHLFSLRRRLSLRSAPVTIAAVLHKYWTGVSLKWPTFSTGQR